MSAGSENLEDSTLLVRCSGAAFLPAPQGDVPEDSEVEAVSHAETVLDAESVSDAKVGETMTSRSSDDEDDDSMTLSLSMVLVLMAMGRMVMGMMNSKYIRARACMSVHDAR